MGKTKGMARGGIEKKERRSREEPIHGGRAGDGVFPFLSTHRCGSNQKSRTSFVQQSYRAFEIYELGRKNLQWELRGWGCEPVNFKGSSKLWFP